MRDRRETRGDAENGAGRVGDRVRDERGVRANGAGHSWHEGLFCAETRIDARETRSVAAPGRFAVDDDAMVVRADAGMSTRDLLDGIAEMGYALPAVPWFIDQTIGGAVATATHGSSLSYRACRRKWSRVRL